MEHVLQFLREQGKSFFNTQGIHVVSVADEREGIALALPLFASILSKQAVVYLSGGRTPKALYAHIAKEEMIIPGAFAMVDERYGPPMHENSNELMLKESGLLRYAQMRQIPFYQMLKGDNREETADAYDQTVRELHARYQQHVALLGIGMDGHTAGIPAPLSVGLKDEALTTWLEDLKNRSRSRMVIDYDDARGFYKERITMTYAGLLMMDILIVLVFGNDKKMALELMFEDGPEDEVPSRFFKRPDIVKKTILLTDQPI